MNRVFHFKNPEIKTGDLMFKFYPGLEAYLFKSPPGTQVKVGDGNPEDSRMEDLVRKLQDGSNEKFPESFSGPIRSEADSNIQDLRFKGAVAAARNPGIGSQTAETNQLIGICSGSVVAVVRIYQGWKIFLNQIV